jgi:L-fuconolactonase
MPSFPIVDSHLHLWDPQRLTYPWLFDPLDRAFLPADFRAASAGVEIEALVFLECDAVIDQAYDEAQQVLAWAQEEPRIAAMVCNAPLERGDAARADLDRLAATEKVCGRIS